MPHGEEDEAQRGARGEVTPANACTREGPIRKCALANGVPNNIKATWQKVNERESDEIWLSETTLNI